MTDPESFNAYAIGTAVVLGAVTTLLTELRHWRGRGEQREQRHEERDDHEKK